MREPAGTAGGSGDPPAERVLAAAHPDGRERDRAIGWLVWIAGQMGAGRDLAWWQIPDWIGEAGLRAARTLTGAVLLGMAFGLGFGGYLGVRGLPAGLVAALAAAASSEVAARPVTDPGAVGRFLGETAVVAAVDLANQVRYLQEGDGPCHGCARPEPPADRRGPGSEDHPVRPPEFIP